MFRPLIIAFVLLCILPVPGVSQQNPHTTRLGDLQITVTATRIASDQDIADYSLHPRDGYNVALVFVRVKNVARYPNCTYLDEWLLVKQGYEYPRFAGFKISTPKSFDLLPTDESFGEFAFEIKAGTEPTSLKLVRNPISEGFCAGSQHRYAETGPETVSLSLLGVPAGAKAPMSTSQVPPPPAKPVTTVGLASAPPPSPPARPGTAQPKIEVTEQESNVVLMDDGFEYRIVDYGVGRIQVRAAPQSFLSKPLGMFTQPVFWTEFQITNKAEHLVGNPRYFPSVLNPLYVTDNWGNTYSLRYPDYQDVGGNWSGAELPIPGREGREQYKPNDSSWAVRLIPTEKFVDGLKDLRIYLTGRYDYPKFYFKIEEPLLRQRDLTRGQPVPSNLRVKVVTEKKGS